MGAVALEKEHGRDEEEHDRYRHRLVEQKEEGGHKNDCVGDPIASYIRIERGMGCSAHHVQEKVRLPAM